MRSLGEAGKAAAMLAGLILASAIFALSLRSAFWNELQNNYRTSFSWSPGSHFGRAIGTLRDEGGDACVILGNSAAREALDPVRLTAELPGKSFVNAGTTGGNNLVFELQARLLAAHHARPRCVILAMNSWNMFSGGRPAIAADDYLALLRWRDLAGLSYRPLSSREGAGLAANLTLPLKPQGKQLNRMLRHNIWQWRASMGYREPLARYAYFPGELDPAESYLYAGKPDILAKQWAELVERNRPYQNVALYGGAEEKRSLEATLDIMASISPENIVVILPQSAILESASRISAPAFNKALAKNRSQVRVIDCSAVNRPEYLYDEGHLNERGRAVLSVMLARALKGQDGPCVEVGSAKPDAAVGHLHS